MPRKIGNRKGMGISGGGSGGNRTLADCAVEQPTKDESVPWFRNLAMDAAAILRIDEELRREVRGPALKLVEQWGQEVTFQEAARFWANPEESHMFGFFRGYSDGAIVLAYGGIRDIVKQRPDDKLGTAFAPLRKEVFLASLSTLAEVAGSVEAVVASEAKELEWYERRSSQTQSA